MVTLPNIDIVFAQKASTLVQRSARGIVALIIKDDTDKTFNTKEYTSLSDLEKDVTLYTSANYQYIVDTLTFAINKVIVVRVDTTETVADALAILEKVTNTGWITTVGTDEDYTTLGNWVKAKEALNKSYKAVVYNVTSPDSKYVVNFVNANVIFNDARLNQTGENYLPSLAGIFASCNIEKGSTYFHCTNLKGVEEVADVEATLNEGKLVLINDTGKVRIALGINSLVTFGDGTTEDMRFIDFCEAMSLIVDDIVATFKNDFLAKGVKNTLDNQMAFISAVNIYFANLAKEEILDVNYTNIAEINVEAQRAAWTTSNPEVATWDDAKVKNMPYKRNVFLAGNIKINGAMENLQFNITIA